MQKIKIKGEGLCRFDKYLLFPIFNLISQCQGIHSPKVTQKLQLWLLFSFTSLPPCAGEVSFAARRYETCSTAAASLQKLSSHSLCFLCDFMPHLSKLSDAPGTAWAIRPCSCVCFSFIFFSFFLESVTHLACQKKK